jgi:ribonuclease BN (tRNA processing enzyme)
VHDYARVDGVLVSHMHPDHYLDLVPYAYGLMADLISTGAGEQVPLYLPPGGAATLRAVDEALGHSGWRIAASSELGPGYPTLAERFRKSGSLLAAVFAIHEYSPDEELAFGGFRASFHPVEHTVSAFGMRLRHGKSVLAYTGDTRACAAAVKLARGAGTLLCDATLSRSDNADLPGHMSATEAGDLANAAGVGRLVLTHVHGDVSRRERLRAEAAQRFGGEVEVAVEGATHTLT